jgi:hypothetical protein
MRELPVESLDRLLAGELSRSEERRLAQDALSDPDLFEALTAAALTRTALEPELKRRSRRSAAGFAALALAAAAAVVLAVAYSRSSSGPSSPPPVSPPVAAAPAVVQQPVLLAARLDGVPGQTFRADVAHSREPRPTGAVVSVRDGSADVDIGSLDGLTQGGALAVVRDGRPVGRLTITAVFRERARGRVDRGAAVQPGDRVDVEPAVHVGAILDRVAAKKAGGDLPGARDVARLAVSRSQNAAVPADLRRRSLFELAALERQAGDLEQAARLLQQDVDMFDQAPAAAGSERGEVLNELGVVQIDRRELVAAERALGSAQALAAGATRARVANNLGAVAALKGDRTAAERFYRLADSLAATDPALAVDRGAITKNLAGLQASR